jgi:sigma-B regulation protein RsbU (phosphoserine phosphatase)
MQGGAANLSLLSVNGPAPASISLAPPAKISIGRLPAHSLYLNHPQVSRDHAQVTYHADPQGGRWFIADLGSKHGTRLNGVRLPAGEVYPLRAGDYVEILPWTFRIDDRTNQARRALTLPTIDDAASAGLTMAPIRPEAALELDRERLRLILSCAEAIQGAADEQGLATAVLDAAVRGTGFANVAMLRPLSADGTVSIISQMGDIAVAAATPRLSRTLIQEASRGRPVQLMNQQMPMGQAVSIVQLDIQEAICAPLMVESAVVGFLYLDNRGQSRAAGKTTRDAGPFVAGLARLASLALANQMRQELERRYARVQGELAAAAAAQQLILPHREGRLGRFEYAGACQPGRILSGDFFDIFELSDGKLAVTIGDVAGKGVTASVLMTTAQGFIHGALRQHGDPRRAANDLNRFVQDRCEPGVFITLWIGVLDAGPQTLDYIDAGHGYVWLVNTGQPPINLNAGGGPAIGVLEDCQYTVASIGLAPSGCVALVSDGIIEQPAPGMPDHPLQGFGAARVAKCLAAASGQTDPVADLFAAVRSHAGTDALADDATVVIVRW